MKTPTKAEMQLYIDTLRSEKTSLERELEAVPTDIQTANENISELEDAIDDMKDEITQWRRLATWDDKELERHINWLKMREFVKLQDPLPTTREGLVALLASLGDLVTEEDL